MLNILIAEGTPAVWQAERVGFGLPSNSSLIAAAVRLHQPDARCTPLNIADGEALPYGITLSDFDGVMVPGSPLHIYDFGSLRHTPDRFRSHRFCGGRAGLGQLLGPAAGPGGLGGSVRRNPRGRELPIARAITGAGPVAAPRPRDNPCGHFFNGRIEDPAILAGAWRAASPLEPNDANCVAWWDFS